MKKIIIVFSCLIILTSCSKKEIEIEQFDLAKAVKGIDPYLYEMGKLKKGETLAEALSKKEMENGLIYKMVNKLNKLYDLRYAHENDEYAIKMDTLGVVQELAFRPNKIHTYWVVRDSVNVLSARVDTLSLTKNIKVKSGEIDTSLWQAMSDEGIEPSLIVELTQIFQWDIDFFIDPQKGDKFQAVFEEYQNERGQFVKYGNILVANYDSKTYDETAYHYTNKKGKSKYYDEKGVCFQKAFLKSPLNYKRITSTFGSRYHPIRKKSIFHNGVDYAASYGTPV